MKLKRYSIKFLLLATVFVSSADAQELELPRSLRTADIVGQNGEYYQATAPVPAETQQNIQPVNVLPELAKPEEILSPEALNKDTVYTEAAFKQNFDNTSSDRTMEDLLSMAYERNPSINAARDALKTVDEQLNQAYSGFLPNVSYTYSKEFENNDFGGVAGTRSDDPESKSFNLRQGIFGGGETYYNVKAAEERVKAAQNELKNTEQQFLFNAINAYINYIYTQKLLALAENNERVLQEQMGAARERFVVGDSTKTDVAQSEARMANATSNKVIASGDFINAQADFKRIFGADAPDRLPMPGRLPNIPTDLEAALKIGLENNPQLNQAKFLAKSRDSDIKTQASQLYPQVDLTAGLSDAEVSTALGITPRESSSAGITVTVPIYSQGITYSRTREARDRRNQARNIYNDTSNGVRSAVIQAWQNITTTRTNIEATNSSLTASEFALTGVREEQKEGARTILDVLDAEQERFISETAHARAIKDSVLAIYNLKLVLGELNAKELDLSVPEYDPQKHYKNTRFKLIGI